MSKHVWILSASWIIFIFLLVVGWMGLPWADEPPEVKAVTAQFYVFPYYDSDFDPADLKSWKRKVIKCPNGGIDLHVEFKNPETNEVIFGKFWIIDSEYFLVDYWYESLFYDYYYVYDGDESYRFFRKKITDESEQNIQRRNYD